MSSNDRLYDLKAGGAFLVWNVRDYPATCLVMLVQALCYATFRMCQAGKLPFQFQVKFFELYDNRLLSTEAMAEGRYYTLITCVLFMIDWIELLSAWVGLWFILFRIEYAFRWYTALLVLLLPCAAGNAAFLILASWAETEAQGGLVGIRLELLELCRPERNVNVMPWRLEPLWWGMAAFALIRLPTVRVLDEKVPMWLFVAGMLAVEFTIIRWNHGQNYSRESFVASAVAGVLVACLRESASTNPRLVNGIVARCGYRLAMLAADEIIHPSVPQRAITHSTFLGSDQRTKEANEDYAKAKVFRKPGELLFGL